MFLVRVTKHKLSEYIDKLKNSRAKIYCFRLVLLDEDIISKEPLEFEKDIIEKYKLKYEKIRRLRECFMSHGEVAIIFTLAKSKKINDIKIKIDIIYYNEILLSFKGLYSRLGDNMFILDKYFEKLKGKYVDYFIDYIRNMLYYFIYK